jgi:hypothetical protein
LNFFVIAAMAVVLCTVALPAGIIMAIPAIFTLIYIRCVRDRIAFAAAHLQAACDALSSPSAEGLYIVAGIMLVVQTVWNLTWSAAALGVNAYVAGHNTTSSSSVSSMAMTPGRLLQGGVAASAPQLGAVSVDTNGAADSAATLSMFLLLVSFYWGSQVFSNIVHFVTATAVGHWWFGPEPGQATSSRSAVWLGLRRAFTTSFGVMAFGSLIVAVLRAIEVMARGAEGRARRDGNAAAVFFLMCLLCLVKMARRLTEYMNHWAYVFT